MKEFVIDPKLLLYPGCNEASVDSIDDYIDRISKWLQSESRIELAPAGSQFVLEQFVQHGYPDTSLPLPSNGIGKIVARKIGSLIRGGFNESVRDYVEIESPIFRGGDDIREAVARDVAYAIDIERDGLGSCESHWDSSDSLVRLAGGSQLELVFDPNEESTGDAVARVSRYFSGRKLYLVGGKKDGRFISDLQGLGVLPAKLIWVEMESDVSVKILDQKLAGVSGDRYVVACWTGRIGHAGSGKVRDIVGSSGAVHLEAEHLSGLGRQLVELAH